MPFGTMTKETFKRQSSEADRSEAEIEDKSTMDEIISIPYMDDFMDIISDSVYENSYWQLLTFAPLDSAYNKNCGWFSDKMLDVVRKILSKASHRYIIVKEKATKFHIHAIACFKREYETYLKDGGIYYNKMRLDIRLLRTESDRTRALDYIIKDLNKHKAELYKDYIYK